MIKKTIGYNGVLTYFQTNPHWVVQTDNNGDIMGYATNLNMVWVCLKKRYIPTSGSGWSRAEAGPPKGVSEKKAIGPPKGIRYVCQISQEIRLLQVQLWPFISYNWL